MLGELPTQQDQRRLTVIRSTTPVSPVLMNLLRDTSEPALAYMAEQYGLRRVPGLSRQGLMMRITKHLTSRQLENLKDDLIAARFGALSVDGLVKLALVQDKQRAGKPAPRLDHISPENATLVEGSTTRWIYTMRGHDVLVDTHHRVLACDCGYFRFAARRSALCKHLAMVFQLIPEVYSREALIDLLVSREYGAMNGAYWRFAPIYKRQAA
jgi:hypothetical protein